MAKNEKMSAVLDLRGLDMVTPVDLLDKGRTPYSKNFRLYAQQADDRRVAVSSRKGPGFHTTPIGEGLSDSNTGSTAASTTIVGVQSNFQLIPFTANSNERLTRIDLEVSDPEGTGSGPLLVQLYSDDSGKPGKLLSESSISSGDIGETADWQIARFVNAYKLVDTTDYWIVISIQDDGANTYTLETSTDGDNSYMAETILYSAVEQAYTIKYKIYTTPDGRDKGSYRFNRDNGDNVTVVAFGESMYRIDEATGEFIEIIDGLSSDATEYSFTNGDNKVFWVNRYDELTNWDGTIESEAANKISNGTFEVNTTGWAGGSGDTLSRSTSEFHSGVASASVTAASGVRELIQTVAINKNRRLKVTFWAKGAVASGNLSFRINAVATDVVGSVVPITTSWQKVEFYYTPGVDLTSLRLVSSNANVFFDDINIIDTGVEYILDDQLPLLSQITFHKDRIWGVVAADPNKLIFSENPGNPAFDPTGATPTTAREQWYYEWLSVSFWYVPRPHNGSPITKIVSFQDALTIFTQDNKYVLTGYDRGSLYMRQATGNKGALSARGVTYDENKIYFAGSDGLYEYNGSADDKISGLVSPLIDGCPRKDEITPVMWKNQIRFYMASSGSPVNDICLIYDKDMQETLLDTGTYINRAVYYGDADDDQELIEFSSQVPVSYNAEQDYNSVGAPIDFEYRLKYDSMGTPMQRKRLKRFYPILQGVDSTFNIQVSMDKDFEDSPKVKDQLLVTNGAVIGGFDFGDGTILGGATSFKPKRQSYSGYANYWQLRVARKAVNNRVAFVGAQFSYKTKRL